LSEQLFFKKQTKENKRRGNTTTEAYLRAGQKMIEIYILKSRHPAKREKSRKIDISIGSPWICKKLLFKCVI